MMKLLFRAILTLVLQPFRIPLFIFRNKYLPTKILFGTLDLQHLKVDEHLSNQGVTARGLTVFAQGGGIYSYGNGLMVGASGNGGGLSVDREDSKVTAGTGEGGLDLGLMIPVRKRVRFYPFVQAGGTSTSVVVTREKGESSESSDDTRDVTTQGSPLIVTGIGLELRLGWRYGVVIGGQVGVRHLMSGQRKKQPVFRVIYGFGRFEKKQSKAEEVKAKDEAVA